MEPAKFILWDVIEEHLDEAAFLSTQWEQALVSTQYHLDEVADRVEARMLAHIDGLALGGSAVAERLLAPALVQGSGGTAFAAAMAMLADASAELDGAVLAALGKGEAPAEVQRALQLCPSSRRKAALLPLVASGQAGIRAAAASVLGFQQVDLGAALFTLLDERDDELFAAGLYCLRYRPRPGCETAIRRSWDSVNAAVVSTGLLAGAIAGMREVLEVSRSIVRNRHPATPTAALLLGLFGEPADARLLQAAVVAQDHAAAILFALALSGTRDVADACLQWLCVPELALAASEAFIIITGADPDKDQIVASADTEIPTGSEAEELVADPNASIQSNGSPIDAVLAASWWQNKRSSFDSSGRHLLGERFDSRDPRAWHTAMNRGSMRLRHPLAFGLAVVSAETLPLQTLALCERQRAFSLS